jgi:hypothetical protein
MKKLEAIKEISKPVTKDKIEAFFVKENIQYFKRYWDNKTILRLINSQGIELEFSDTSIQFSHKGFYITSDYDQISQFSFYKNKFVIFGTRNIIEFRLEPK